MRLEKLVLASAISAVWAASGLQERTTCHSGVYVLSARGTNEPADGSILNGIVQGITAAIPNSFGEEVNYPAALDFIPSITTGVQFVTQRLTDYASNCPDNNVVLLGYSQGAVVHEIVLAGTNLSNVNITPIATSIGQKVVALVQFGDPTQVPGQGTNGLGSGQCQVAPPLARQGSYKTTMDTYADRLLNFCNPNDPVCCGSGKDPYAHGWYFGQNATDIVVDFVKQKLANLDHMGNSTSTTSTSAPTPSATSSNSPQPYTGNAGQAKLSFTIMLAAVLCGVANL